MTRHPKVRRFVEPAVAGSLVNDLRHFAEVLAELPRVEVSADPGDNFLLAMAEAGKADYLATGDKRRRARAEATRLDADRDGEAPARTVGAISGAGRV